jgi:hypothetical protein
MYETPMLDNGTRHEYFKTLNSLHMNESSELVRLY